MRISGLVAISLALAATTFLPATATQAAGPTPVYTCGTISVAGSYVLEKNLSTTGNCLKITANSVTIDLAGFSIVGPGSSSSGPAGIVTTATVEGTTVRNGSISNFSTGVNLSSSSSSIIEGLVVLGNFTEINANNAIVRSNIVEHNDEGISVSGSSIVTKNLALGNHLGIGAVGTVSDNIASGNLDNIIVNSGSTVIGNTISVGSTGLSVQCPSNVIDNTATGSHPNLSLSGTGCNSVNNVAP
jgi:hypothetical protein